MNKRSSHIFLVCLLALFGPPALAQVAPVKTVPTKFALVWADASGTVPPQLALQADYYAYPAGTSLRSFLAQPAQSSLEAYIAHCLLMPTRDAGEITRDQEALKGFKDIRLYDRYDVGAFRYVNVAYRTGSKQVPDGFLALSLRASPHAYSLVGVEADPDGIFGLFSETDWNLYDLGPHWNNAPKPQYRYSLSLPGPFPAADKSHPLKILFNGRRSHLLIDSRTAATDPISAFVKQVVQTYRTGTRNQFLSLWTPEDVRERFSTGTKGAADFVLQERARFQHKRVYLVFTIDCGPNAIVFLADADHPQSPCEHLYLWKGSSPEYHLTRGVYAGLSITAGVKKYYLDGTHTSGAEMQALFSSEDSAAGAVDYLFDGPLFQSYLKTITDDPKSIAGSP